MKTEGLSWAEAIKAYANGERIRNRRGHEFWIGVAGDCPRSQDDNGDGDYELPCSTDTPFSIVKPEPKRLTFEEALTLVFKGRENQIRVQIPDGDAEHYWEPGAEEHFTITFLAVAELKGWPITLADAP